MIQYYSVKQKHTSTVPGSLVTVETISRNTAYTALAYSYWASFHNAYECLRHAH